MAVKKRAGGAPKSDLTREVIQQRLRAAGLRATQGRIATYEVLHQSKQPMTHGDVADTLQGMGMDRVTIYRNLQDFTEVGLASRTDRGDHVWRFELDGRHSGHPHFVCTDCGEMSCLENVDVKVRGKGVPRALSSEAVDVHLRGRCDSCIAE